MINNVRKKAFTLVEIIIATVILSIIFLVIMKTILGLDHHNIKLAQNIQNTTNQMKLQTFFTENQVDNIIFLYSGLGTDTNMDTTMSNNDYLSSDYKDVIDNIIFANNNLWIKKTINIDLWNGIKIKKLPFLIFKDKSDKLGVIWFVSDINNKNAKALSLKIFYLNDNFYFNTKWNVRISDLLYYYKNLTDSNLLAKYNNYIKDLLLSWKTILDNVIIIPNNERWKYSKFNYVTLKFLQQMLIVFPTKNLKLSNSNAYTIYKQSIDNLWNSKLYYWNLFIQYYKSGKLYWLNNNFLVK